MNQQKRNLLDMTLQNCNIEDTERFFKSGVIIRIVFFGRDRLFKNPQPLQAECYHSQFKGVIACQITIFKIINIQCSSF